MGWMRRSAPPESGLPFAVRVRVFLTSSFESARLSSDEADDFPSTGFSVLPQFPQLRRLTLMPGPVFKRGPLAHTLAVCRSLTHLCLDCSGIPRPLADPDVGTLLHACAHLRSLELVNVDMAASEHMECLAQVAPTLELLTIGRNCAFHLLKAPLRLPELMPQLRALHVHVDTLNRSSFKRVERQRYDAAMTTHFLLEPLQPPSALWPSLRELVCRSLPTRDAAWRPQLHDPNCDEL